MASTTSTQSSFGQTLQFITDIKLQELEKQRLAYQARAKVIDEVNVLGENGDILNKVEVLAKAIKSWSGSGSVKDLKIVSGKLNLTNLEFWLQQAKKDPSFSREIAQGWVDTLEEHIRHNLTRFDAAKLFGILFNEWLTSGDSVALAYQAGADDNSFPDIASVGASSDFVEVGRKELYEQKEKFQSIIFEDRPVDAEKLKAYLEGLFESEEGVKALKNLRNEIKSFSKWLQRALITTADVKNAIKGLLASGLMNEEKRTTLKAFEENPTVLDEVASVLNMRMASLDSWSWPKEGIVVEFRRHLNGKYRAFTDPEIIDALLLHHIGVAWQVKLKAALRNIFDSKAWTRPQPPNAKVREQWKEQLRGDDGGSSIDSIRNTTRRDNFFLTQLQDQASNPNPYDDLVDAPERKRGKRGATEVVPVGPAEVKQKLLHIMTTECYLNTALHGTHAMVCSDLEWFGPSLPRTSILTVLEFFGMSKTWLDFYKTFLAAPLRLTGESESRIRKRGTPISYALSVVCGEAIIFIMDFAVNQCTNGVFLYRMHDDLWLWDADVSKVARGWAEMNTYADLVGLTFNRKKTGSAYVGTSSEASVVLPKGDIRWGFLKFDATESRFLLDQVDVDLYIIEMRRQLANTKSVFGWVNAYNKYMTFFMRNFGGLPANCFSKTHIVSLIDTLARIQRELFPDGGGAVSYLRKTLKDRFNVTDLPEGYFYFPITSGGLELRNAMLELLALEKRDKPLATYGDNRVADEEEDNDLEEVGSNRDSDDSGEHFPSTDEDIDVDRDYDDIDCTSDNSSISTSVIDKDDVFDVEKVTAEDLFTKRIEHDHKEYKRMKEVWDLDIDNRWIRSYVPYQLRSDEFMTFEDFVSLRESWRSTWGIAYKHMLASPNVRHVTLVPSVRQLVDFPESSKPWAWMDWYEKWVISMYGGEFVKKYGSLEAVDPNLIPVGMVELFRSSRMKLDQ